MGQVIWYDRDKSQRKGAITMYNMKQTNYRRSYGRNYRKMEPRADLLPPKTKNKFFSMDTLMNLTETIATLTIGAGCLLLMAACLAGLC